MALVGIELVTLVSEPDALTTRPPPCRSKMLNRAFPSAEKFVVKSVVLYFK